MSKAQMKTPFYDTLTKRDQALCRELAEIEMEDADRCAHCGGEDCVCCEYYLDRQKWEEPEDLFDPIQEAPPMDSEDFIEWCDAVGADVESDDDYRDFCDEWYREQRPDFMY